VVRTYVWVTDTFAALHRWKDAPESVKFLRDYHRHVFHVKLTVRVRGDDREVEFFTLKRNLRDVLNVGYHDKVFDLSCEQVAAQLLIYFQNQYEVQSVEVSEDGENGALVVKE